MSEGFLLPKDQIDLPFLKLDKKRKLSQGSNSSLRIRPLNVSTATGREEAASPHPLGELRERTALFC